MRQLILAIPVLFMGMQFAAKADTIPAGTEIAVRTDDPIRVSQWGRGRIYSGHIARDVVARDGDVAIPRGANVELIVRRIGDDEMALDLESVSVNGRRYVVDNATGPEFSTRTRDGVVGSILGTVTGDEVELRGREIRVPADAVVRF